MSAFKFIPVHKNIIKHGDIISYNEKIMTVSRRDIKNDGFLGLTIFGDCFHLGKKLVMKGVYDDPVKKS